VPFESSKDTITGGASPKECLHKTLKTGHCAMVFKYRGGYFDALIGKKKRVKGESLHDIPPGSIRLLFVASFLDIEKYPVFQTFT